jgi:hypothetical protein
VNIGPFVPKGYQFQNWPEWLQVLVILPHSILGFVATWLWWPKTDKGWRKFGFVAAYLFLVFLVMRYVFDAR